MRIGAVYPTYIYNTNRVSSRSLDRINAIPNDALKSKIGYTGSSENTNPLRPGTSRDFAGIIVSQMAMGRRNAARIMRQPQQSEITTQAAQVQSQPLSEDKVQDNVQNNVQNAIEPMAVSEA